MVALVLALAGCAGVVPPAGPPDATGTLAVASLELDGSAHTTHWYLPTGEAAALVVLQHGFTRQCAHLRETSRRLMAAGLMVLCVDAPMAGGNPSLAESLGQALAGGLAAPGGRALPPAIIVGGHSAGAAFAARLGARLDTVAPQRLAGALLFDPVAVAGFDAQLRQVSDAGRRPVLALLARPHGCNADGNAATALRQVQQAALAAGRSGFVGVQFGEGSTHADVEGEDSDWIARAACGRPLPRHVALLRGLAVQWALDLARGAAPAPAATEGAGWWPISPVPADASPEAAGDAGVDAAFARQRIRRASM